MTASAHINILIVSGPLGSWVSRVEKTRPDPTALPTTASALPILPFRDSGLHEICSAQGKVGRCPAERQIAKTIQRADSIDARTSRPYPRTIKDRLFAGSNRSPASGPVRSYRLTGSPPYPNAQRLQTIRFLYRTSVPLGPQISGSGSRPHRHQTQHRVGLIAFALS